MPKVIIMCKESPFDAPKSQAACYGRIRVDVRRIIVIDKVEAADRKIDDEDSRSKEDAKDRHFLRQACLAPKPKVHRVRAWEDSKRIERRFRGFDDSLEMKMERSHIALLRSNRRLERVSSIILN